VLNGCRSDAQIQYVDYVDGAGIPLFEQICKPDLEGIVAKQKYAPRRILGILALAKKYGIAAVDEACAAALEMGVHEYRFVRRYLERCPQAPLSLRQVDP
jgi:hypothetical protein